MLSLVRLWTDLGLDDFVFCFFFFFYNVVAYGFLLLFGAVVVVPFWASISTVGMTGETSTIGGTRGATSRGGMPSCCWSLDVSIFFVVPPPSSSSTSLWSFDLSVSDWSSCSFFFSAYFFLAPSTDFSATHFLFVSLAASAATWHTTYCVAI